MHLIISIILGVIVAWAAQRRDGDDALGYWRPGAGAVAAALPHMDGLLYMFAGPAFAVRHLRADTWSFLLAPIFAAGVAVVFALLSDGHKKIDDDANPRRWQAYFLPALLAILFTDIGGTLTGRGIAPLAPLWYGRLDMDVLYNFDMNILFCGFVFMVVGFVFKRFWRDIARLALIVWLGYAVTVVTFHVKALHVAETYAQNLKLQVAHVYAEPQPMSAFHWQLVVQTKDARFHVTRVHLYLRQARQVLPDSPRAWRVAATYKPIDQAVWRVYNRFGRDDEDQLHDVWQKAIVPHLARQSVFTVYNGHQIIKGQACLSYRDARFNGPRWGLLGAFAVCPLKNGGWQLYQAAEDGSFLRFDTIY